MSKSTLFLLDTHVWIWLANGDKRLRSSKHLEALEEAGRKSSIKVSVISVWEVGMLEAKGRIVLPRPPFDWIKHALSGPGISLAPLTEEIAFESTRLPGVFHGDPADRIIVATARALEAVLFTSDKEILYYAKSRHVEVVPL